MGKDMMKQNNRGGKFNKKKHSKKKEDSKKHEKVKVGRISKPQKSKKHKKMKNTIDTNDFAAFYDDKRKLQNLPIADGKEDSQEVPRKVRELMDLTAKMKANKGKLKHPKKIKETFKMERGMSRPLPSIPRFVKGKYETDRHFMSRVELETQRVLVRASLEEKYQMEITGPTADNKSIDPLTGVAYSKKRSESKKMKDKEKKKKKKEAKMEKRLNKQGDFASFQDDVAFGDVAMQPPSLSAKPRKAKSEDRPAQRGLLLNQMMTNTTTVKDSDPSSSSGSKPVTKSLAQRQVGQTVKRKYLSLAQQRITDKERDRAINQYRKIRNEKLQQITGHNGDG